MTYSRRFLGLELDSFMGANGTIETGGLPAINP